MHKILLLIAGLALLTLALPTQSRADACPAIGYAATCNLTITFGTGGTITPALGAATPYDKVDDQLIGIINNSGGTLTSITLTGLNIFGFEALSDGAGMPSGGCTDDGTGGPNGCPAGPFGSTGYEGPNTSFSAVDSNNGTVFFTGGLASGQTAWFSLESTASLNGFTITGTTTGAPEPSSLFLLGSGLLSLFGFARRRLNA